MIDVYMTGLIGTVQQLETANAGSGGGGGGGGGSPPGLVSIATSASGNFNDAVIIGCNQDPTNGFLDVNSGSTFSNHPLTGITGTIGYTVGPNYSSAVIGNSGVLEYTVFGYIRVGVNTATSFQWDVTFQNDGDTNNAWTAISTNGTASTAQDRTSNDVGEDIKVVHSSGGRGYNLPAPFGNSFIEFDVDADATNSGGTTSASTVKVTLESN